MKKLLFISWDGPQTTYLEGLFCPIFKEIVKHIDIEFHLLQFTWGDKKQIEQRKLALDNQGFIYNSIKIQRKPHPAIGCTLTINKGIRFLKKYIAENNIDILMPRSTIPAIMINKIRNALNGVKIIFDADGEPILERVDYGTMKRNDLLYKYLMNNENKIIKNANAVIVRSEYSIKYHSDSNSIDKYFIVANGRNPIDYKYNVNFRNQIREKLHIADNEILLIYIGSLGGKYALKEMVDLYKLLKEKRNNSKFIILTPFTEIAHHICVDKACEDIIIKMVEKKDVIKYLSAADYGLCLIYQTESMKYVSAVKVGEYLMSGLPVIATSKIGDIDNILYNQNFCFLLNTNNCVSDSVDWIIKNNGNFNRNQINMFAVSNFSIQKSANDYTKAIKYALIK